MESGVFSTNASIVSRNFEWIRGLGGNWRGGMALYMAAKERKKR